MHKGVFFFSSSNDVVKSLSTPEGFDGDQAAFDAAWSVSGVMFLSPQSPVEFYNECFSLNLGNRTSNIGANAGIKIVVNTTHYNATTFRLLSVFNSGQSIIMADKELMGSTILTPSLPVLSGKDAKHKMYLTSYVVKTTE